MSIQDCCSVCADPLEWAGIGPCRHKETCSRCVARLRFVLQDKRCVICQQEMSAVYFTRFMGDYTTCLTAEQFQNLQAVTAKGDIYLLPEVDGYFDDRQHFDAIKSLCGHVHPILKQGEASKGKPPPAFTSIESLRKYIEREHKKCFCDVCLKGRKVFTCEQMLYTRPELDRHMRTGDLEGPLAESGFKGHPSCRFCHVHFFDSGELYRHMESDHEHCFICRRTNQDKHVYFRQYAELEEHFQRKHHACPHPTCMENRFVVFGTELELKRHFATEHGDEMKLSRSQKREAMMVPISIQIRPQSEAEHALQQQMERPGLVIGGGQNFPSRHGPRARHSRSDPQLSAALQASAEEASTSGSAADVGAPASIVFDAADFPSVSASTTTNLTSGRWTSGSGGALVGNVTEDNFPALPRAPRRRNNDPSRTSVAAQLRAAARPVQVLNRGATQQQQQQQHSHSAGRSRGAASHETAPTPAEAAAVARAIAASLRPTSPPPTVPSGARSNTQAESAQAQVLQAQEQWQQVGRGAPSRQQQQQQLGSQQEGPSRQQQQQFAVLENTPEEMPSAPAVRQQPASWDAPAAAAARQQSAQARPPTVTAAEDFPELPTRRKARMPDALPMRPAGKPLAAVVQAEAPGIRLLSSPNVTSRGNAGTTAAAPSIPPTEDDFPALPERARRGQRQQQQKLASSSSAASTSAAAAAAAAGPAAAAALGGVSQTLKAANKALIEKIKRQLSADSFAAFRKESAEFMQGQVAAGPFHARMVELGLLGVVAELAALCPDDTRRMQLILVHSAFLASPSAQEPSTSGAFWMPPEAASAAATLAQQSPSWPCMHCTLVNAPFSKACEACGSGRPPPGTATTSIASTNGDPGPSQPNRPTTSNSAEEEILDMYSPSNSKRKNKGKKGGGKDEEISPAAGASSSAPRVHPQNVWTQSRTPSKQSEGPAPVPAQSGAWSRDGGVKLVQTVSATQHAWAKS